MQFLGFVVGLSMILGKIATEKVSPRPGLKSFRDDYDSIAKTCVAVGYVKDHCKSNSDRRNMVIAFNAKTKGSVQTVSSGSTIMFGDVDLNKGGGFNAAKGIFTAPKSGVYVFDWTTVTHQSKYAYTALYINSKTNVYNHCHNNGHDIHMSCSKMAVLRLEIGDKASIKCFSGTASVYPKYSSFSGFML
ncbi:cerebellin-3-like [Saccostrea cucullata]|uniref:cerebellin-3-like n=1 Tax=Saccostrea cuccullata TaxID=36930 RepID=UPI002ED454D2